MKNEIRCMIPVTCVHGRVENERATDVLDIKIKDRLKTLKRRKKRKVASYLSV